MDIKSAAQTIRDTVDMQTILDLYGYQTKHGFMVCPFHADKGPSLKVYKGTGGWHCYGCHRGGSVIDFVMEHENCDFPTAVRAIDQSCRLNLFPVNENAFRADDWRQMQHTFDVFASAIYRYLDTLEFCIEVDQRILMTRMKTARDKEVKDRTWEECMTLLTFDEDSQHNDERIEKIREFREEVAAWRRMARRAGSA